MGVTIKAADVEAALRDAFMRASREGETLIHDESLRDWCDRLRHLQQSIVPRTYLPVALSLLLARAMHGDLVDATLLQAKAGAKGFSASTIAGVLAGFAKSHEIDLRSTSQSPFNNQPFTFKETLADVEPSDRHWLPFMALLDTADAINKMSREEATRALAVSLVLTRRAVSPTRRVDVSGGRDALTQVAGDVAAFVAEHSDGGRVGQALCAALLDLIHGDVLLGVVNDPDARLAGDVHAMEAGAPWLWCEVKQKVVVTGDVVSFLRKVADTGGQRCLYLALANHGDLAKIDVHQVGRDAEAFGVDMTLVQSPKRAIDLLTRFAPGEMGIVAARLLERLRIRLVESNGSPDVLAAYDELVRRHGTLR